MADSVNVKLIRIDDRLIHGQVSVGWAARLKPDVIVVLDDEAASDTWENNLVCSACPDWSRAQVLEVETGARQLLDKSQAGLGVIILLRSVRSAVRLLDTGFPIPELNIGGLHFHEGSREYLPYVYLDDEEVRQLLDLAGRGVRIVAQDLPGNKAVDLLPLLTGRKR